MQRTQTVNAGNQGGYKNPICRPHVSVESQAQGQPTGSSVEERPMVKLYCKLHGQALCAECFTTGDGHTCNAMLGTDVELKCGCTAPVLAEACDLVSQIKAKMPVSDGCLVGRKVRVLRDNGCSTVVVRRGLVSEDKS